MKIKNVRTVRLELPPVQPKTPARRDPWAAHGPVANPMTRYPRYSAFRPSWLPHWPGFVCVVEAEDGTCGFATGGHGRPVAAVIEDHLGPRVTGEDCLATEKLWDMAVRMCSPIGIAGLASFAVSALDLALWDLKGKLLGKPVYELLGGPARDNLECYATGNDTDWYLELGFQANKLACPYGPADGLEGLRRNVDLIAEKRALLGDGRELMLDCWMAFDVEYGVRLAEAARPYGLKWMEECILPDDMDSHAELRKRVPWQTLATGEHWFSPYPFQHAATQKLVDIFQPDINWVGGLTAVQKIVAIADAAGLTTILHGGGTTPYGQHASYALPGLVWTEYFVATPPGVPLEECGRLPGVPMYQDGVLKPADAPGFGVELDVTTLPPFFA